MAQKLPRFERQNFKYTRELQVELTYYMSNFKYSVAVYNAPSFHRYLGNKDETPVYFRHGACIMYIPYKMIDVNGEEDNQNVNNRVRKASRNHCSCMHSK